MAQVKRACSPVAIVFLVVFLISTAVNLSDCFNARDELATELQLKASSDTPYSCEWSYLQIQDLSLIGYTINHLTLIDRNNQSDVEEVSAEFTDGYGSIEAKDFALSEIALNVTTEELKSSRLDPNLPFIFFINGFNTINQDGEVNGTWMYDAAKMFAQRGLQNRRNKREPELGANIIFLTWGIPEIFTQNLLALLPSYYKTLANYDLILNFVSETILKMIGFVEESHEQEGGWQSTEARADYYAGFQFFGHSLGSHIITDAVNRVRRKYNSRLSFGKLTCLDPAMPCFLGLGHSMAKEKLTNSTVELIILHSNAGFAGLTSERANVEIVLNGGTFQPGCSWWDLSCDHKRSTEIFGYMDDRCQMVAYKCTSYHHFKSGACETCDYEPRRAGAKQSDTFGENCILVNRPEQHVDTNETIAFVNQISDEAVRQLADEEDQFDYGLFGGRGSQVNWRLMSTNSILRTMQSRGPNTSSIVERQQKQQKRTYYHYVNTNPNFATGRKTHCLQHYQVRMMVLQDSEKGKKVSCPISSYYTNRGDAVQVRLFHNDELLRRQQTPVGWTSAKDQQRALKSSPDIRLGKIINDNLYTALLNFEGSPELFVGAEILNIDLNKLSKCLNSQNATIGKSLNLVLDIAFMSHTNRKFRHAFSSLLCSTIPSTANEDKAKDQEDSDRLLLRLCKQSELSAVGGQIDKLLDQLEQQNMNESWRVSLLNSLFSLFAEWQPF